MTQWSTAYVDSLPNSSFAWIDSKGGRHLPYKDANGKVDHNHAANALARLNQVQGMSDSERSSVKSKLQKALDESNTKAFAEGQIRTLRPVTLDSNGDLPTRVPLFTTGEWPNSIKGKMSITVDDLKEMKSNFDAGIGFPTEDASTGLPVDFMHEYKNKAAAWIKGLELSIDSDGEKATMYANPIEWTDAGATAVRSGEFKCISPSYWGKKLGGWPNPNNLKERIANVVDGAGLTNIPFLRGMQPIRASAMSDDSLMDEGTIILMESSQKNDKEKKMTIDEVRVKAADQLSTEDKTFLEEHRSELSADELKKFGMTAANTDDKEKNTLSAEDAKLLADIKAGNKKVVEASANIVDPSRLTALEATAEQYRTEKAEGVVEAHIARGAIKQDSKDFWTKQLLSADGAARDDLEAQLKALPDNELLAKELGSAEDTAAGSTARDQLAAIASKKVADASKDGKQLLYADALREAIRENSALSDQDLVETKLKAGAN